MLGLDVYEKTLGIIGMGRIGQAVAKRATGFEMRIIYYNDSSLSQTLAFEAREVTLKTLLQEADIITLHLPLTKETFHLISKEEFALMKESAVLINTSRGAVIEEKE